MIRIVAACLLVLALAATASAQGVAVRRICPIDGKSFQYQARPAPASREAFLDMKSVDSTEPWPHAKCPENGFVMYKSSFSSDEISKLREFVLSDAYRSLVETHSTRYLEAALRKHLGEAPYDVAWSLVQATWEVASDPARYKQYAEEALATYEGIKIESLREARHRVLKQMISGELERRLGLFDKARDRFFGMRDGAEFATKFLQRVIDLQLKLIRAKDTSSQRMPY